MERSIKLIGSDEGVKMLLDDVVKAAFTQNEAINALSLYEALDYHASDTYSIAECDNGPVPNGPFNSLKDLIESILDGINALNDTNSDNSGSEADCSPRS